MAADFSCFYSVDVNIQRLHQKNEISAKKLLQVNKHPRRKRTGYLNELPAIEDFIAMLFKRCKQRGI